MVSRLRSLRSSTGRLYYGWTMLTALALAEVTSWGILYYAFPVFLEPMRAEFGWSIAQMTGAYSLALLLAGLAAIPVGWWLDKHGPRLLMTVGSCVAVLLVIAWSQTSNLLGFYLIWAGIGLVMAAVLYEPAFFVVATWFERLRSRAINWLTFVAGFASVVYLPLTGWLVENYDWRTTLLILAGILAAGTIPIHALVVRNRPANLGLRVDGGREPVEETQPETSPAPAMGPRDALRDVAFWWLNAAFVLAMLSAVSITVHLIPYLMSQGYSAGFAATATGLIGAAALPGRLIFTPLGGRLERRYVVSLMFLLQTASLVALLLADSRTGVLIFVLLFGAGFGAITPARAALIAEMYGAARYGTIAGITSLCVTLARAAAPLGAGLLYAAFEGYDPVIIVLIAVSAAAALTVLGARPQVRREMVSPYAA